MCSSSRTSAVMAFTPHDRRGGRDPLKRIWTPRPLSSPPNPRPGHERLRAVPVSRSAERRHFHVAFPKLSSSKPMRSSSRRPTSASCARPEFDEQRTRTAAIPRPGSELLHHALEEHAFVRHVLIDDRDACRRSR